MESYILVQRNNQPEFYLEAKLRAFVPKQALREKAARPTSHELQRMKSRLGDTPFTTFRPQFVGSIDEKRNQRDNE